MLVEGISLFADSTSIAIKLTRMEDYSSVNERCR